MTSVADKTKRARSNVAAATKQIGVTGVLNQLEALMRSETKMAPQTTKHYQRLADILQDARYAFRAECDNYDRECAEVICGCSQPVQSHTVQGLIFDLYELAQAKLTNQKFGTIHRLEQRVHESALSARQRIAQFAVQFGGAA